MLLYLYYIATLDINVPLPICLGSVTELTCITNETSILGWRYKSFESYYDNPNQVTHTPVSVGPFTIRLIHVQGSEFTSVATINTTTNLNGTTLDCADNDFSLSNTVIKSFKFSLNGNNDNNNNNSNNNSNSNNTKIFQLTNNNY